MHLLDAVWRVRFDQVGVVSVQLNILHISDIVHDLELLHEVGFHSLFDHVSAGKVAPYASLNDDNVLLDHKEYVAINLHTEVGLDVGSRIVEVMKFAADDETS